MTNQKVVIFGIILLAVRIEYSRVQGAAGAVGNLAVPVLVGKCISNKDVKENVLLKHKNVLFKAAPRRWLTTVRKTENEHDQQKGDEWEIK